jgi:hypothetical protein
MTDNFLDAVGNLLGLVIGVPLAFAVALGMTVAFFGTMALLVGLFLRLVLSVV